MKKKMRETTGPSKSLDPKTAFVATIKRDYVYTSDCRDAQTVIKLFKKWIQDYNNVAPHSGLGMKSPVEYRKSVNQGGLVEMGVKSRAYFHKATYIITAFTTFVFFSGCRNFQAVKGKRCWNDINFKKIEKQLRSSPVIKKIPLSRWLNIPEKPRNQTSFVLLLNNNLKAVFKLCGGDGLSSLRCASTLMAYRFSQLMRLKLVPPTTIRTVSGEEGTVQFFVDGVTGFEYDGIKHLTPLKKATIYIFYFVSGVHDVGKKHIIFGKNCRRPALIDNDDIMTRRIIFRYGDYPFFPYNIRNVNHWRFIYLHPQEWHKIPFNKMKLLKLKSPRMPMLKTIFPDMEDHSFFILKNWHSNTLQNKMFFSRWRNAYWIKMNLEDRKYIFKDFLPTVFPEQAIRRLQKIEIQDLSLPFSFYDHSIPKWYFPDLLYRKDVILKEALKLKKSPKRF